MAKYTVWPYQPDCLTLHVANYTQNAVYTIDPIGGRVTDTWCDMTNGGWTVIQRRMDGSEDFNRGWDNYANGFGDRFGEYWLGLENIHHLTMNDSHLEIRLEGFPGVTPTSVIAHYTHFAVLDKTSYYSLQVGGFEGVTGNCGNFFSYHTGSPFTTFDNDNDANTTGNCAVNFRGGWWFDDSHYANLNGVYYANKLDAISSQAPRGHGIRWGFCWNVTYPAHTSLMKLKTSLL